MRTYKESDIFNMMNTNSAITNQLTNAVKSIGPDTILNRFIQQSLSDMNKAYKDSISKNVIDAVNSQQLILCAFPADKVFPAKMPFITVKRDGKFVSVVDLTRWVRLERDNASGKITGATCPPTTLYSVLVPALLACTTLREGVTVPLIALKHMAVMWAAMFNKVLKGQKIFIASNERYEAFMYLAIKFFVIYYFKAPSLHADKIALEYIGGKKNSYLEFVEANIANRKLDIYADWTTFVGAIFSNDITNVKSATGGVEINAEEYIRQFSRSMGMDGAFMSLWSADYFVYCVFSAWNKAYILNDRNWEDVINAQRRCMPEMMLSLYKNM